MNERMITDEDLVAFLDGEVDLARAQTIEAAIERNADLKRRLDALTIDIASVRDAFGDLAGQAPPMPALAQTSVDSSPRRTRLWPSLVAASLAGAIIAGGATALLLPTQEAGWRDYVASYQALYVNRTLSHVDADAEKQAAELALVADAIGKDIPLGALAGSDDLDYKRAQILGFEGRPLVQFAFLSKVGAPVALCIIQTTDTGEERVASGQMEGLSTASWESGGYAYLLIGGTDDRTITDAAQRFAAKL